LFAPGPTPDARPPASLGKPLEKTKANFSCRADPRRHCDWLPSAFDAALPLLQ
jgi:hypothetical protein